MEAPERIWGDWTGRDAAFRYTSTCRHLSTDMEYVRADLATARENALREALEKIIAHESVMFLEQPPLEVVKVLQDSIKAKKDIAREALEVR